MSSRPLAPATRPVSPATDPIGPPTRHARTELASAHHFAPPQALGQFDHRQWKLPTTSVRVHGATVPYDAPPQKMPRASSSSRNGFSEFTAIAKSPWRILRMPAASPPPTSIGISQAVARSSTRSRRTTCTRPNAQRSLARSATAIQRGTGSVAFSAA
jgi:hypothetical protein